MFVSMIKESSSVLLESERIRNLVRGFFTTISSIAILIENNYVEKKQWERNI